MFPCSAKPGSSLLADAVAHVSVDVGVLHPTSQRRALPLSHLPPGLPQRSSRPLLSAGGRVLTGRWQKLVFPSSPRLSCVSNLLSSCRNVTTSCSRGTDWSTTRSRPTGWPSAPSWLSRCCRCPAPSPSSEVRQRGFEVLESNNWQRQILVELLSSASCCFRMTICELLCSSLCRIPRPVGPLPRIPSHCQGPEPSLRPRGPARQRVCGQRVVPLPKQLSSSTQVSLVQSFECCALP